MTGWEQSLADLEERLRHQGTRARALSPRTRAAYVKDARMLAAWLAAHDVPGPERVTPSALEAAMRDLGWSAATRARAITAADEWLAPHHPVGRAPSGRVRRPRVTPALVPRLSQDEAAFLVESVVPDGPLGLRDRAVLELLYGSGLRRQEVCDLRLGALDFEHETARIAGKGGTLRTVPLTEPSVASLSAWLRDGRPRLLRAGGRVPEEVFLSRGGRPLDGSAVYRIVARRLRSMGRGGGPHVLRHAAATHLLEGPPGGQGAHLRVVQEVLGHASLATTQRYTGVTTRAVQQMLVRGHPRG